MVAMRLERRLAVRGQLRSERDVLRRPETRREKALVAGSLGALALFLGLPLAGVVERSLAIGPGHGLDAYRALTRPTSTLLVTPWEAIGNSIVYAAAATAIALAGRRACRLRARGRTGEPRVRRPAHAPARRVGRDAGVRVRHRLRRGLARLPVRALDRAGRPGARRDPLRRAHRHTHAARDRRATARGGGAPRRRSPARASRDRPSRSPPARSRWRRASRSRSRSASSARPSSSRGPISPTLPVAIFRFLGRPGALNVAQAYALAVILMVVTTASILLVERFGRRRPGWF